MTRQRIAKYLAAAGICSRRQGEELIAAGRIKLNDQIVTTPATFVDDGDVVSFDNRTVRLTGLRKVWAFYKPAECITSRVDPEGRKTIYDILPPSFQNIRYVGRLDYLSEGLLLLTNDGALVRHLELPSHRIPRVYRVRVYGTVKPDLVKKLADGMTIEGVHYQGIHAEIEASEGRNTWIKMTLIEGKNREIRNIMTYLGYKVNRLMRIGYGPFSIDGLKPGQVIELSIDALDSYLERL
jgi:23S rRNA pseudouridine2605 synthase